MTEQPTPAPPGEPPVSLMANLTADLTADPMVLASGVLVVLGLLLLLVGVTGNWHWKAAVWGAVLASVAAFGLVAYSANQRRDEFPAEDDADAADQVTSRRGRPAKAVKVADVGPDALAPTGQAAVVKADAESDDAPPRPRFAGFGKPKPVEPGPPEIKPPPPQPTNVQVMHVQGSNVRVAPTPQPMPIARPERPAARPPSTPPATPPTIQVGVAREPSFPTYQPVDPEAPVIQVRNRYHRPECRYVAVAAAGDRLDTTVGAARATHAMPCGVCRP